MLFAHRLYIEWDLVRATRTLGHGERALVAEERPEHSVRHVDIDWESLCRVISPLPDVGVAGEQHREVEPDPAFVEAHRPERARRAPSSSTEHWMPTARCWWVLR